MRLEETPIGSNERCNRRHCSHQLVEHRRARSDDGQRLLVGACHHDGCECAEYVSEGLTTGNRVGSIYGDHGKAATRELLDVPLPERLPDGFVIVRW